MTMRIVLTRRAFAAGMAMLPALADARAAGASSVTVDNFVFTPEEARVRPGDTVTWTNDDDIPHTITAKDLSFRSKPLDTGDAFSMTFAAAGRIEYFCSLHPHMVGVVVVAA